MAELIASGRMIEAILVFTLAEGLILTLHHRRTGLGLAPADLCYILTPGLCLMMALREALVGGWWGWIAACLAAALLAHVADLRRRWRR